MKISLAILAASASAVSAFVTTASGPVSVSSLRMSEEVAESETPEVPAAPAVKPINGWVPDSSKPCFGLPGATAPFGYFDPVGFCSVRKQIIFVLAVV